MSLFSWFFREFNAWRNAVDDYFLGLFQVVPVDQQRVRELEQRVLELERAEEIRQEELMEIEVRRIQNLTEIESILDSRKELKAMRNVKRRLNLTVSYINSENLYQQQKNYRKTSTSGKRNSGKIRD